MKIKEFLFELSDRLFSLIVLLVLLGFIKFLLLILFVDVRSLEELLHVISLWDDGGVLY